MKKFKGIYIYSSFAIQETEDRKTSFSRLHMLEAPSVTGGTFHSDEGNQSDSEHNKIKESSLDKWIHENQYQRTPQDNWPKTRRPTLPTL